MVSEITRIFFTIKKIILMIKNKLSKIGELSVLEIHIVIKKKEE
jgi:hypothetical protein